MHFIGQKSLALITETTLTMNITSLNTQLTNNHGEPASVVSSFVIIGSLIRTAYYNPSRAWLLCHCLVREHFYSNILHFAFLISTWQIMHFHCSSCRMQFILLIRNILFTGKFQLRLTNCSAAENWNSQCGNECWVVCTLWINVSSSHSPQYTTTIGQCGYTCRSLVYWHLDVFTWRIL